MTNPDPDLVHFKGQYQEWCRVQLQFAHHDNWWIKDAQLKAGNLTLVLLGAVLGASKLLWSYRENVPYAALKLLWVLSGAVVVLGGVYAWDLFKTLVKSRKVAGEIAGLVVDSENVLEPTKRPAKRDAVFPIVITLIEASAWGVALLYFGARAPWLVVPLLVWGVLMWWGLRRVEPEAGKSSGKPASSPSVAPVPRERRNAILGPVGRLIGNVASRIAIWWDPAQEARFTFPRGLKKEQGTP